MQGYLVTFYTQQNRTVGDVPLAEWLVTEARKLGVRGATLFSAREGFGHDGRFHSAGFFDLEDQPLQVAMAVSPAEREQLFARIREHGIRVFHTTAQVEFGFTDET